MTMILRVALLIMLCATMASSLAGAYGSWETTDGALNVDAAALDALIAEFEANLERAIRTNAAHPQYLEDLKAHLEELNRIRSAGADDYADDYVAASEQAYGNAQPIIVGDAVFSMRLAPAATFPTGVHDREEATVETAFWIAETPVTYELWYEVRQWALRQGYTFSREGREGSNGQTGAAPTAEQQQPVTRVEWRDCIVWTNALSEMLGYNPVYTYEGQVIRDATNAEACDNAIQEDSNGFRLPTSDEWELAARYQGEDSSHGAISMGGLWWTPGEYASGAVAPVSDASATREVAWYDREDGDITKEVGLKRPNTLGLYDMSGNVWEWTFTGVTSRYQRGGAINRGAVSLRVGARDLQGPDNIDRTRGFRIAKTQF